MKRVAIAVIASLAVLYLGLTIWALLPQDTIPIAALSGPQDRFVTVDGRAIHYLKQGNGKQLILVHGFAGSTYTWRKLAALLAERYALLSFL